MQAMKEILKPDYNDYLRTEEGEKQKRALSPARVSHDRPMLTIEGIERSSGQGGLLEN